MCYSFPNNERVLLAPYPEFPEIVKLEFADTYLSLSPTVFYNNSILVEAHRDGWPSMYSTGINHLYWIVTHEGVLRNWGVHEHTTDRYSAVYGKIEVALYDGRKHEPTFGQLLNISLDSANGEGLIIPVGVYHTFRSLSPVSVLMNSKTPPFNAANPDKKTIPLQNDLIPNPWS